MFELGLFYAFKIRTYLVTQLFGFVDLILQLTAYRILISIEGKRLIKTVCAVFR